jgi:hypothetical protein
LLSSTESHRKFLQEQVGDEDILVVARDNTSRQFTFIHSYFGRDTNPFWITSEAAQVAYERGLIDETEFDYLTR